jgi:hypothetical protein
LLCWKSQISPIYDVGTSYDSYDVGTSFYDSSYGIYDDGTSYGTSSYDDSSYGIYDDGTSSYDSSVDGMISYTFVYLDTFVGFHPASTNFYMPNILR